MKFQILDLFSGLGGASEAFVDDPDWVVRRIDNNRLVADVPHTIIADVMGYTPRIEYDLIWASPPCTEFSQARKPQIPNPSMKLVERTIAIIEATNPRCWIIENVKGAIKHFAPLLGPPRLILGPYCFWGNFPLFWVDMEGYSKMEDDAWSTDPLRPQKRAYVPIEISTALREALRQQTTLESFQ